MTAPADPTTPDAPVEGSAPAVDPAPPVEEPAPWGDDFDPAKAWKTIQTQRASEKALAEKVKAFEKAEQEKADAEKTEAERAIARAEKAEADLAAARREALLARVAKKHGIEDDLLDFLTGADEETLETQATRLASLKPSTTPPPGRPTPRLTPGDAANPSDEPDFDPAAIAARIKSRQTL